MTRGVVIVAAGALVAFAGLIASMRGEGDAAIGPAAAGPVAVVATGVGMVPVADPSLRKAFDE